MELKASHFWGWHINRSSHAYYLSSLSISLRLIKVCLGIGKQVPNYRFKLSKNSKLRSIQRNNFPFSISSENWSSVSWNLHRNISRNRYVSFVHSPLFNHREASFFIYSHLNSLNSLFLISGTNEQTLVKNLAVPDMKSFACQERV